VGNIGLGRPAARRIDAGRPNPSGSTEPRSGRVHPRRHHIPPARLLPAWARLRPTQHAPVARLAIGLPQRLPTGGGLRIGEFRGVGVNWVLGLGVGGRGAILSIEAISTVNTGTGILQIESIGSGARAGRAHSLIR
jgi:hypothetical protein